MKKLLITLIALLGLTSCGGKVSYNVKTLTGISCKCPDTFYVGNILRSRDLNVKASYNDGSIDSAFGYKCEMLGYTFNEEDVGKEIPISVELNGKIATTFTTVIEKEEPEVKTILEYSLTEDRKGWEVYSRCVGKTVEIPSTYTYEEKDEEERVIYSLTLPVVAIAEEGFSYSSKLESVTLPTSVKTIGVGAFNGCNKLESINLNNVEKIGACAFTACNLQELVSSNFVNTKSIGYQAFSQNRKLTKVDLRYSKVTTINPGCFMLCDNLKEVSLPAVTEIGSLAFNYCTHLTYIRLPMTNAVDWYNIKKAYNWRTNSSIKTAICKDDSIILTEPEPEVVGTIGERLEDVSIQFKGVDANNDHIYEITSGYDVVRVYLGDDEITSYSVNNSIITLSNPNNKKVIVVVKEAEV